MLPLFNLDPGHGGGHAGEKEALTQDSACFMGHCLHLTDPSASCGFQTQVSGRRVLKGKCARIRHLKGNKEQCVLSVIKLLQMKMRILGSFVFSTVNLTTSSYSSGETGGDTSEGDV